MSGDLTACRHGGCLCDLVMFTLWHGLDNKDGGVQGGGLHVALLWTVLGVDPMTPTLRLSPSPPRGLGHAEGRLAGWLAGWLITGLGQRDSPRRAGGRSLRRRHDSPSGREQAHLWRGDVSITARFDVFLARKNYSLLQLGSPLTHTLTNSHSLSLSQWHTHIHVHTHTDADTHINTQLRHQPCWGFSPGKHCESSPQFILQCVTMSY